ncbi:MAG: response regulator [Opitutae bacterium]|nr:response regulator [Opitutae bacterium]
MPHTILVVDDAKAVRALAKQALAPLGLAVSEATNGYNALFAMEKSLPDLLLLDVKMPIMDGLELLTMMRSNPTLARVPVVMLTSPADHPILGQLTALGVSAILKKPFDPAALVEAAQRALGRAN